MPKSVGALRAEREVIRLCHSGLDNAGIRGPVVRALRRVIPIDAVFLATSDPDTLLFTGAWPEEPLDTVTSLFMDNELAGGDVNKFAALATSSRPIGSLDEATAGDRHASPRYRDIMRPLGLGDEVRAALRTGPDCWGYLCLHRADGRLGFTTAETTALARLTPHIAHALRTALLLNGTVADTTTPAPGVVLLSPDLTLIAMTPEAEQALSLVEHDGGGRPLPLAVYGVAGALAAIDSGTAHPAHLPSARLRTRAGTWLNLHASRLNRTSGEPGGVTVIVEPVDPRATIPLMLSAHGLSRREAEVTRLVLRGQPTRIIADELHIASYTVQEHLKAVFDKFGVRSRRDLVSQLLGTHTTPQ